MTGSVGNGSGSGSAGSESGDLSTQVGSQIFGGPEATHDAHRPEAAPTLSGTAAPWSSTTSGNPARSGPITLDLATGTIIGGAFRVEGRLGAGGMGVVYRATHLKLDRPVALKLHAAGDLDAARLEREARAMARLSHPNVIGVFDVGTWRDPIGEVHVFIAMEFCDAGTLRAFLGTRPHWRRALDTCRQAGEGLAAAHAAGLVHRDFKPDNVLLSTDGRVRVADFGLARGHGLSGGAGSVSTMPGGTSAELATPSDQLTRTGALVGTPAYMAPEQFGGRAVDARADQFAFCVVAYEALWGRRPFQGATAGELLYNVSLRGPVAPAKSEVPSRVWEVLRRGLDADPSRRHASMRALLAELDRACKATGPSGATIGLAVGIPVLLVGIGVGSWWAMRDDHTREPSPATADRSAPAEPTVEPAHDSAAGGDPHAADPTGGSAPEPGAPEPREPERDELDEVVNELEAIDARWKAVQALGDENILEDPLAVAKKLEEAHAQGAGDMALMFGVVKGMMPDPDDPPEAHTPAWDHTSTLRCGHGDSFRVEGETIEVAEGPAFEVAAGCTLYVVDCTITAPIVVKGNAANRVELVDSTVTATERVLELSNTGYTVIRKLEMTRATTGAAVLVSNGKGEIVDSALHGTPGLQAGTGAQLKVQGGSIEGDPDAIVGANCAVDLADVEIRGGVQRGHAARIAQVELKP